ncbi:asparagine synthase (glutamine-hydrolyzing) [candidate division WS5 bacterium]|uniref:asparagine synthase (glutamine-hydrolyzing) n=1 Tax=candidate division WS5 bacterium TaxID=2093353 RepID=A0A419DF52_9BACT|nr:MAG: asparagine synthase (glutamine-hydrolyzing) [candidate division WS5 bacterium]
MCGIAGKISSRNSQQEREAIVTSMVLALSNRGPDGNGLISLPNVTFGHTRLAILDLSANAAQPMCDESKRFTITYNGEVYNFQELRRELIEAHYKFISNSDTEVVLKSYIHWGAKCFEKFNGMFALAIWDNLKSELILARDRFGKKPLFYYVSPDLSSVSFASTLTAIMRDNNIPCNISMEALNCFLSLGYILTPLSYMDAVHKLEPSHYLQIAFSSKTIKKTKYWDYAKFFYTKTKESQTEICDNILIRLKKAVKIRMISDVPLGVFLSGGIDSTSVVKIMSEYTPDVSAFSIGFDNPCYNELDYAKETARNLSLKNHFYKILSTGNVPEEMTSMFDAFDEPFADTSLIPMMLLSKFTRSKITVALSGDAGDEIFGGYPTYQADIISDKYRMLPLIIRKFFASIANTIPVSLNRKVGFDYKLKQFIRGAVYGAEQSHYNWRLMFSPEERIQILGSNYRELVYDTDPFSRFQKYYNEVKELHALDRHLYVDVKTWLVDDILVKLDRSTMFVGLEARCPFLDNDLVEYVAGIPTSFKIKGLTLKYMMKKTMSGYLPEDVIKRKKSGFNAPVSRWIQQPIELDNRDSLLALKNEYSYFVWHVYKEYLRKGKISNEFN